MHKKLFAVVAAFTCLTGLVGCAGNDVAGSDRDIEDAVAASAGPDTAPALNMSSPLIARLGAFSEAATEVYLFEDFGSLASEADLVVRGSLGDSFVSRTVGEEPEPGDPGVTVYGAELTVSKVLGGTIDSPDGTVLLEFAFDPGDGNSGEAVFFLLDTEKEARRLGFASRVEAAGGAEGLGKTELPYSYVLISSQGVAVPSESGSVMLPTVAQEARLQKDAAKHAWKDLAKTVATERSR
jgi:hypothetical protein